MNRLLILALVACGSKPQPALAPVSNVEPAATAEQTRGPGEARVIQRKQDGGVIELANNRQPAMKSANDEMEKHCGPSAYVIVQLGEEATMPRDGTGKMMTVWRVHYQCSR